MQLETWQVLASIGLLLIIAEVFTAGFFALPAGLAFIATAFWSPFISSLPVLGVVLTAHLIASYFVLHRVVKPRFFTAEIPTAASGMIGKAASVETAIEPHVRGGYVKLYGDLWPADADEALPVGTLVTIVKLEGNRVFVARREP